MFHGVVPLYKIGDGMVVNDTDGLFLRVEEAHASIQSALTQYPFSLHLLSTLWPLVFGDASYFQEESGRQRVWVKLPDQKKLICSDPTELRDLLRMKLQKCVLSIDRLAELCKLIFGVRVSVERESDGKSDLGVWIHTDMGRFVCSRCGHCCKALDIKNGVSPSDYHFWQKSGRQDILDWVSVVQEKGEILSCRIWINPLTNAFTESCPWLEKVADRNIYRCKIHNVRPSVCRHYPGSRKHARVTGCKGVFK